MVSPDDCPSAVLLGEGIDVEGADDEGADGKAVTPALGLWDCADDCGDELPADPEQDAMVKQAHRTAALATNRRIMPRDVWCLPMRRLLSTMQ
jgi:hypothetical protein